MLNTGAKASEVRDLDSVLRKELNDTINEFASDGMLILLSYHRLTCIQLFVLSALPTLISTRNAIGMNPLLEASLAFPLLVSVIPFVLRYQGLLLLANALVSPFAWSLEIVSTISPCY